MSNVTYDTNWREVNREAAALLEYESPTNQALVPKDAETQFSHVTMLYVRYILVYKKLEATYDQMLHPQKKRIIRELLDAIIGRLVEMKARLVETRDSDFVNMEEVLLDLKLNPRDLELNAPSFLSAQSAKKQAVERTYLETRNFPAFVYGNEAKLGDHMTLAQAVRIIQINERGRQGKVRAKFMADLKLQPGEKQGLEEEDNGVDVELAARKIQRAFRGFIAKVRRYQEAQEDAVFLGMVDKADQEDSFPEKKKAAANRERRHALSAEYENNYQQALVSIKEKIALLEGPDIRESVLDTFRQWYLEFRKAKGKFPDFPPDEDYIAADFDFQKYNAKLEEAAAAAAAAEESKGKEKKDAKKGQEEEVAPIPVPVTITAIMKSLEEFHNAWEDKDESDNFSQTHDTDLIRVAKRREVGTEIKATLLTLVKEELANLKAASEKDSKGKKKDKKGSAGKKGKKDAKGKAKEMGPIEPVLEELIPFGLLQKPMPVKLSEFIGDQRLIRSDTPGTYYLGDVKKLISEACVIPLSFPNPTGSIPIPQTVFLFGPKGSGKRMLINAIATETGAMLYNVTPRVIGLATNPGKTLASVFKAAKMTAPSIIYIGDAEIIFAKKIGKDEPFDGRKLKKDFLKCLKGLTPADNITIVGCSHKPWEGEAKALLGAFQRHIYIPIPDYGSRNMLWAHGIARCHGKLEPSFQMDTLSRLSAGCSAGDVLLFKILYICEKVLSNRRIRMMRTKPLEISEFLKAISALPPRAPDEQINFQETAKKLLGPRKPPTPTE